VAVIDTGFGIIFAFVISVGVEEQAVIPINSKDDKTAVMMFDFLMGGYFILIVQIP